MPNKLQAAKLMVTAATPIFFSAVEGLADDGKLDSHEILSIAATIAKTLMDLTGNKTAIDVNHLETAFIDAGFAIVEIDLEL